MIAFARYADTICPLTLGHEAWGHFLDTVKLVTRRSEDGTAIGDAVALAAARLKTAEETLAQQAGTKERMYQIKSKVIILLTDGENNCGDRSVEDAAELAAKWGIRIYAVGITGDTSVQVMKNVFGTFRIPGMGAQVDERGMNLLAERTGGFFRTADDARALKAVYEEIDELERSEIESVRFVDYRELFGPFALSALCVLALEVLLSGTLFRRIP
jgi:Ca-activated chloride channel family protein